MLTSYELSSCTILLACRVRTSVRRITATVCTLLDSVEAGSSRIITPLHAVRLCMSLMYNFKKLWSWFPTLGIIVHPWNSYSLHSFLEESQFRLYLFSFAYSPILCDMSVLFVGSILVAYSICRMMHQQNIICSIEEAFFALYSESWSNISLVLVLLGGSRYLTRATININP